MIRFTSQNRSSRFRSRSLVAAALGLVLASISMTAACPSTGSLLFRRCTTPGSSCDLGTGTCTNVSGTSGGVGWTACRCIKRKKKAGTGLGTGGAWRAFTEQPLAPNSAAVINLDYYHMGDYAPFVEAFDYADTDDGGNVVESQILNAPDDLLGWMQIQIGDGPADRIPVQVVQLWWQLGPVEFHNEQMGLSVITFDSESGTGQGYWNSIEGEITFEDDIKCYLSNDLLGDNYPMTIRPVYLFAGGDTFDVLPSMSIWHDLDLAAPVPGNAGTNNTFAVSGAAIGETQYFVYGFQSGSTSIPGCSGAYADIRNPKVFGTAVGDATGRASLEVYVPAAASGRTVLFQVVELGSCTVSNLVQHYFP